MQPMKSFYLFSKLFGLCPYSLDTTVPVNTRASYVKQLLPTYTVLLLYSSCLVSIFWQSGNTSDISNAANWIQFIPNSFAYIFSLVFAIRHRTMANEILTTFAICDDKLRTQFGISFTMPNVKMRRVSILACIVTMTCGSTIGALTYLIGVNWNRIWTLLYWIAFCMPKFGLLLFSFQFAGCILYLSDRSMLLLRGMNNFPVGGESLALQPQAHGHAQYKTLNMAMGGNHLPSMHEGKLNRLTTLATIKIRAISPLDSIQHIREVVEMLQDLSVKINHCFGKQAIFSLLSAFTCVTVQLYYMLNHIKSGFTASRSEIYALASCSLLFLHGIEFWSLFTSGENVRLKWKKVINFLFFMKSKSVDDDFRNKVDDLISFMVTNPLEFNAYGLFPIDLSVLTGIASSITTYLIVLIQFKISEEQSSGYDDDSEDKSQIQYSAH
ncbi:gustatory and pheromone receptor 32a-like [Anopheles maculipalpis]|uniref:gustatory and pheromone receptor 32a-like n=1 Tax=Anopheles maculipalpis TaxID=1496333 RepID=UPI0021594FCD|nr:gustatory and pheromone receptor 32a-like [Anopheles maculipalpis]